MIKIYKEEFTHGEYADQYVSEPYEILTSKSVHSNDFDGDEYYDYIDELVKEQDEMLDSLGYVLGDDYIVEFLDSTRLINDDIASSIERLAIKDGYDLVRFKDGSIGFVGYYNGFKNNAFKILFPTNAIECYMGEDSEWLYLVADEEAEKLVEYVTGLDAAEIPTYDIINGKNCFVISPDMDGYNELYSLNLVEINNFIDDSEIQNM
jgi:hypothetical protein